MKLVADDKIPHIADLFTECDELVLLPGESITRNDLIHADILLIRTVTPVNAALLANTTVKFVGSATSGIDHIDTYYLKQQHIFFANAEGANTKAVVEYVQLCVTALQQHHQLPIKNNVAGVIGCGKIGSMVARFFKSLGFVVLCYDPFLQSIQQTSVESFNFVSLEQLMCDANLITIHTPLTTTKPHPTFHMIDHRLLHLMQKNAVLINTARGNVIDQVALLTANNITLCLDVWENEPEISIELLNKVFIGTPHIAGYSVAAKYRATEMVYESAAKFFGWKKKSLLESHCQTKHRQYDYDPYAHTQQFRAAFHGISESTEIRTIFIHERKQYPLR